MTKFLVVIGEDCNLLNCYQMLVNSNFEIGRDYRWAWYQSMWAVEFGTSASRTAFLLKIDHNLDCRPVDLTE